MTKPKAPTLKPIPAGTITDNLGMSIRAADNWISEADHGAVVMSMRLALTIDTIMDTGMDLDKLSSLIGRLEGLMKELKLTPLSRDRSSIKAEEVDHGTAYAESYLRLVQSTDSKPKPSRAKSGTNSRSTSQ